MIISHIISRIYFSPTHSCELGVPVDAYLYPVLNFNPIKYANESNSHANTCDLQLTNLTDQLVRYSAWCSQFNQHLYFTILQLQPTELFTHDVAAESAKLFTLEWLAVKVAPHLISRTTKDNQITFLNLVCEEEMPHIQCP